MEPPWKYRARTSDDRITDSRVFPSGTVYDMLQIRIKKNGRRNREDIGPIIDNFKREILGSRVINILNNYSHVIQDLEMKKPHHVILSLRKMVLPSALSITSGIDRIHMKSKTLTTQEGISGFGSWSLATQ